MNALIVDRPPCYRSSIEWHETLLGVSNQDKTQALTWAIVKAQLVKYLPQTCSSIEAVILASPLPPHPPNPSDKLWSQPKLPKSKQGNQVENLSVVQRE